MVNFTSFLSRLRGWLRTPVRLPVLLGPVFFHELVRSGRRGRHTFLRLLYTGIILTFIYLTYSEWTIRSPLNSRRLAGFAFSCFTTYTLVQLSAVFLLTPAYLATTITEEREGKTLEFLLATDLGSREIVLGKMLARLANIALLLLAGLPILSLMEFSGGVAPDWVLVAFAATFITMLSLGTLSTLCSVYARKSLNALICTYLIVIVYLAVSATLQVVLGFPALAGVHLWAHDDALTVADLVEGFGAGNLPLAIMRLNQSLRTRSTGAVLLELLRNYAVFHGVVCAFCLGGTIARLRPVSRIHADGAPPRRRRAYVRPPVWRQPILWKELFVEADVRLGWAGKTGIFIFFLICLSPAFIELGGLFSRGLTHFLLDLDLQGPRGGGDALQSFHQWGDTRERMNLWVSIVGTASLCALLLIMLVRATGSLSGEAARQTLDSLLTTPLSARAIVAGKAVGCLVPLRTGWWALLIIALAAYGTRALDLWLVPAVAAAATIYAAFFIVLGLWLSAVCGVTTRATLVGLSAAIGTALAPGIPVAVVQMWYFNDQRGFRDLAPGFDLVYLFSPPELLRFLVLRGPSSLWTRFPGVTLVLTCCGHLCAYTVATIFLWRSLCNRLRVEVKAVEPLPEQEPALPPLAAKESLV